MSSSATVVVVTSGGGVVTSGGGVVGRFGGAGRLGVVGRGAVTAGGAGIVTIGAGAGVVGMAMCDERASDRPHRVDMDVGRRAEQPGRGRHEQLGGAPARALSGQCHSPRLDRFA